MLLWHHGRGTVHSAVDGPGAGGRGGGGGGAIIGVTIRNVTDGHQSGPQTTVEWIIIHIHCQVCVYSEIVWRCNQVMG